MDVRPGSANDRGASALAWLVAVLILGVVAAVVVVAVGRVGP
ncbi:MAG: hypothetical protein ACRDH8_03165 [Actinomycetota bacterium]